MNGVLDTGRGPMWAPKQRRPLGRCTSCEQHAATQGHHAYCPRVESTDRPAEVGVCPRCQQPRSQLVGYDSRGRPACADCTEVVA